MDKEYKIKKSLGTCIALRDSEHIKKGDSNFFNYEVKKSQPNQHNCVLHNSHINTFIWETQPSLQSFEKNKRQKG